MTKIIVFEGGDGAGKTTTIKILSEKLKTAKIDFHYQKGLITRTFFGKLSRFYPCTLTFLLEQIYCNFKFVRPALRAGKIVILDRYYYSMQSYVPDSDFWYNKIFLKILPKLLKKPDIFILLTVNLNSRIARLKNGDHNKYHHLQINNPVLITKREEKYHEIYTGFDGHKQLFDTEQISAGDIATTIYNQITE